MKDAGRNLIPTLMALDWLMPFIDKFPPEIAAKGRAAANAAISKCLPRRSSSA